MAPPDGSQGYGRASFYETVTAAINDITANGFDSVDRIETWIQRIRRAAIETMTPARVLEKTLNDTMRTIYTRMVERGGLIKMHPGVSRFTLEQVKPKLRSELDRRIMASAQLIKLNREQAIEETIRRFSGWATSIPAGGSKVVDKVDTKDNIRKALTQLPFQERRVAIDQGYKFTRSLSETLATDGGAIAVIWRSHFRQAGYDYREDHKERDGNVYLLRGNWASEAGLVKKGPAGYYDEITAFAEEVFCKCFGVYLYSLRDLPPDMLTKKGADQLAKFRLAF